MPKKTLYQIVTDLTTSAVLTSKMDLFFNASIDTLGVPAYVANAMAGVIGNESSVMYRLWDTQKNNCRACNPLDMLQMKPLVTFLSISIQNSIRRGCMFSNTLGSKNSN